LIYTTEDGNKRDRQLHYGLIEKGKKKLKLRERNVARLVALGMPEAEAKKAFRG
jgi:DNA-binding CsgD family transcriptional regulator